MEIKLFDKYSIQFAENIEDFFLFISTYRPIVFSQDFDFQYKFILSPKEKENISNLKNNFSEIYRLVFYILYKNEKIGWHYGKQTDAETFYMVNTAIFKKHQNKGIYTSLLPIIIDILKKKGFQKVFSRHKSSNNQIIIPKLKQDFLITAMEVDDVFGVLIHLTYYFNNLRKNIVHYRTGQLRLDTQMKQYLSLNDK